MKSSFVIVFSSVFFVVAGLGWLGAHLVSAEQDAEVQETFFEEAPPHQRARLPVSYPLPTAANRESESRHVG